MRKYHGYVCIDASEELDDFFYDYIYGERPYAHKRIIND